MSPPIEELIKTRSSPINRNGFPTLYTKARLMAFGVIVLVFLLQTRHIVNLPLFMRASSFSGAVATNNPSSSLATNPPTGMGPSISANMTNDTPIGEEPNSLPVPSAGLRLDWTQLDLHSSMAKRIAAHQSSCDIPEAIFPWRNKAAGIGSDLTLWSYGICRGMQLGQRLISPRPWIHWSQVSCPINDNSSMTCYFPRSEDLCTTVNEQALAKKDNSSRPPRSQLRIEQDGRVRDECWSLLQQENLTKKEFVGSATEFLFSSVSSRVVDSAVERLPLVFPPHGIVPPNMITVHIRWGDKGTEMDLVSIHSYIDACHQILQRRRHQLQRLRNQVTGSQGGTNQTNLADSIPIYTNHSGSSKDGDPVHIFLATEDPTAVQAMRANMPSHWKLYVDPYVQEFSQYRQKGFGGNAHMTKAQRGTPALAGLASLLIAMEANDFVLTTASNWSRLMNDLRRFIVQQHFSNTVIDLRPNNRPSRK